MIFSDRITIQQDNSTDDNPAEVFGTFVADIPCRVVDVTGIEKYRGRQIESLVNYVIDCYEYPGITSEMRVSVDDGLHAGKLLNIESVADYRTDGKPKMTSLHCTELA